MLATDFVGSNKVLAKPSGWTDEQCYSLPILIANDGDGIPFILSAWTPSKEDIEAFQRGEPLYLRVSGTCMPPVAMFTMNENDEPNF